MTKQGEVAAYTIGAFWYCLTCVAILGEDDELEPALEGDMDPSETCWCDSCGDPIRRLS